MKVLGPGCRVVCSTDDSGIAAAAGSWGAEVPFVRPADLASDGARSIDVVFHALDALGNDVDTVVLLQPTSPLTDVDDVLGAIALHRESQLPVVSVCPAEHPAEWLYSIDEGRLSRLLPSVTSPDQRQQAQITFRLNGAVYACSPSDLRRYDSFFGPDTRAFVMPAERSIDIDGALDLNVARAIVAQRPVGAVSIAGRIVGAGQPCFVIAEVDPPSVNDPGAAVRFVDKAAEAGADAVHIDRLQREMAAYRGLRGIGVTTTIGDDGSCDDLEASGLVALRLPAEAATDIALVRSAARSGKALLLSTDGLTLPKISLAVDAIREEGCRDLVLLVDGDRSVDSATHTLGAMTTLREAFSAPVGLVDCSQDDALVAAAVALGACVVMKRGADAATSRQQTLPAPIDHLELVAQTVRCIRRVEDRL